MSINFSALLNSWGRLFLHYIKYILIKCAAQARRGEARLPATFLRLYSARQGRGQDCPSLTLRVSFEFFLRMRQLSRIKGRFRNTTTVRTVHSGLHMEGLARKGNIFHFYFSFLSRLNANICRSKIIFQSVVCFSLSFSISIPDNCAYCFKGVVLFAQLKLLAAFTWFLIRVLLPYFQ